MYGLSRQAAFLLMGIVKQYRLFPGHRPRLAVYFRRLEELWPNRILIFCTSPEYFGGREMVRYPIESFYELRKHRLVQPALNRSRRTDYVFGEYGQYNRWKLTPKAFEWTQDYTLDDQGNIVDMRERIVFMGEKLEENLRREDQVQVLLAEREV